ncbi:MAG: trimeric intracellular cation channel family protein [Crocinitomicaceae bacterium]|nr:trimeric intracellular cation channel family protein [Crocinitomicaceae bacterium]
MSWIYFVDLFGTCVFAISGVLTAIHKKFDLVGSLIIGFVTAIGGGTIRDVLIGRFPVGWLNDRYYFLAVIIGFMVAYLFKNEVMKLKRSMFLFDTIGIGLFTILGIEISMNQGLNYEISIVLGVISACFGGIIRDVLTNEIPLIFRKEIYASACFLGGLIYLVSRELHLPQNANILLSILTVSLIRYFSIRYAWSLQILKNENEGFSADDEI